MDPSITEILRLVALGLVVSALMMAWFKTGKKAFNPLSGYQLWPKESKWQFLLGAALLAVIELVNWIN